MATLKEIRRNLQAIKIIKNLANIYQEIANLRMQKIRERVLKTRSVLQELLKTYERIKTAYLFSLQKQKRHHRTSEHKKGEVVVFLSANESFYGRLIFDIWQEVQKYIKEREATLVVVGKMGKYFAERAGLGNRMFYFDLDDAKIEEEKIRKIFDFIKNYKKVVVIHGEYKKIGQQVPKISEISGMEYSHAQQGKIGENYLFEPSPEAVLNYFENEILLIFFSQTIFEHQLARYSARLIAMFEAVERGKELQKKYERLEKRLKREIINKRQIEFFGKLNKWR